MSTLPAEMSDEEFDALLARVPSSVVTRPSGVKALDVASIILEVGPIDPARVQAMIDHVEQGTPLDRPEINLKHLRHTHHRLAQLLSNGMDETVAAKLCNYSHERVWQLKQDPAFRDLLAHYTGRVDEEFSDFVTAAAGLGMDTLQELQRRLDEDPEQFSTGALMKLLETTADRTGNGPMAKNLNVNINADLGSKLKAARERAQAAAVASLARAN